jgi:anti-sigma regulatory factor (Ser/Thr protein kinase)
MVNEFQVELPPDLSASAHARRHTVELLNGRCPQPLVDDVLIVVSELVTNAVRHTGGACALSVQVGTGQIVVEVCDGDGRPPVATRMQAVSLGRGLGMVQMLTTRWGIERQPHGKTVWAEISMAPPWLPAGPEA